jgi:hypothetical protein
MEIFEKNGSYRLIITLTQGSILTETLRKGRIKLKHKKREILMTFYKDLIALRNRLKTALFDTVIVKVDNLKKTSIKGVDQVKNNLSKKSSDLLSRISLNSLNESTLDKTIDLRR